MSTHQKYLSLVSDLLFRRIYIIYINDLCKNILQPLVNIYTDETTVYRWNSENLGDPFLAAEPSPDLDMVDKWGKDSLVKSNTT